MNVLSLLEIPDDTGVFAEGLDTWLAAVILETFLTPPIL